MDELIEVPYYPPPYISYLHLCRQLKSERLAHGQTTTSFVHKEKTEVQVRWQATCYITLRSVTGLCKVLAPANWHVWSETGSLRWKMSRAHSKTYHHSIAVRATTQHQTTIV